MADQSSSGFSRNASASSRTPTAYAFGASPCPARPTLTVVQSDPFERDGELDSDDVAEREVLRSTDCVLDRDEVPAIPGEQ
jgi:hypothetical protein